MSEADNLQQTIRRNVRVLMAIRGISTTRALATLLGDNENHLSNRLNGRRKWQLDDIAKLANVFHVEAGLILGDTATLAGAIAPTGTGSNPVPSSATSGYSRRNEASIAEDRQVSALILPFRRREPTVARPDAAEWGPNRAYA